MSDCVVGGDVVTVAGREHGLDPHACRDLALEGPGYENLNLALLLYVLHVYPATLSLHDASVGRLSAHLGVEGAFAQGKQDVSVVKGLCVLHDRVEIFALVALELGGVIGLARKMDYS